jgi:hypothetical protein
LQQFCLQVVDDATEIALEHYGRSFRILSRASRKSKPPLQLLNTFHSLSGQLSLGVRTGGSQSRSVDGSARSERSDKFLERSNKSVESLEQISIFRVFFDALESSNE